MQVNPVALDPLFEKENRERHKAELVLRDGLDVIQIDRRIVPEPFGHAYRNFSWRAPHGGRHRSDHDGLQEVDHLLTGQDHDRPALVGPLEFVQPDLAPAYSPGRSLWSSQPVNSSEIPAPSL